MEHDMTTQLFWINKALTIMRVQFKYALHQSLTC